MAKVTIVCVEGSSVSFTCSLGAGVATWVGPPPHVGDQCDVEIEIDDVLTWGENLRAVDDAPKVGTHGDHMVFVASLILSDVDHVVVAALGQDVLLLEVAGIAHVGEKIAFSTTASNVLLYPICL